MQKDYELMDWTDYFYKENEQDQIWWVDTGWYARGLHLFSFDRKNVYNLFSDYPYKLTEDELAVFNAENPYWRNFFRDRFE